MLWNQRWKRTGRKTAKVLSNTSGRSHGSAVRYCKTAHTLAEYARGLRHPRLHFTPIVSHAMFLQKWVSAPAMWCGNVMKCVCIFCTFTLTPTTILDNTCFVFFIRGLHDYPGTLHATAVMGNMLGDGTMLNASWISPEEIQSFLYFSPRVWRANIFILSAWMACSKITRVCVHHSTQVHYQNYILV